MTVGKALEAWSAQALCDLGIFLSLLSAVLHGADRALARQLSSLELRMSSDLVRALVLVVRDGALLLSVFIGLFHLNLDLMADIKVGLPFVPMATVVLVAALLVKLAAQGPSPRRANRWAAGLVGLGAFLNLVGFVFVMEGPGGEYGLSPDSPWMVPVSWRSNANPSLAMACFVGAFAFVVLEVAVVLLASRVARRDADPSGPRKPHETSEAWE